MNLDKLYYDYRCSKSDFIDRKKARNFSQTFSKKVFAPIYTFIRLTSFQEFVEFIENNFSGKTLISNLLLIYF